MLLSLNWMKDYVDLDIDDIEFASKLSLTGTHVESINNWAKNTQGVVVGRILKIEPHPHADRLVMTQVDIGRDILDIVTGATNMKEGDLVLVAQDGAVLADGTVIRKTDFRGVESEGMMCSYAELGFDDSVIPREFRDGLLIIHDQNVRLGIDAAEALLLNDAVMELEITPNRPDCLSVLGLTREVGATFNKKLKYPKTEVKEGNRHIDEFLKDVTIETEGCLRYTARVAYDVVIEPSPLWLQQRLILSGMRPTNNIVDITNYVMLELGQPVHAFDLDHIENRIIVRDAFDMMQMVTLDGNKRELQSKDVLITDGKRPLALAGVMGGLDSEIESDTKTMLLESAVFAPERVRKTSKRLDLRSEASTRYEKGLSPELCLQVANRVCYMIEQLGAGKIAEGVVDVYPNPQKKTVIEVDPERINALLGLDLDPGTMRDYLIRLDFGVEVKEPGLIVHVPPYRMDVKIEADIAEEIGRLYGFHNIPIKPLSGQLTIGRKSDFRQFEDKIRNEMFALGFSEALSYSFISPKSWDKLQLKENDPKRNAIELINPLGDDFSVMRTTLLSNMLESMQRNQNVKVNDFSLYELGHVFFPQMGEPLEESRLTLGMYGDAVDFYSLKDKVEKLFDALGLEKRRYVALADYPTFHPGRTAEVFVGDESLGVIGEISKPVMEAYNLTKRVYAAEFSVETLKRLVEKETVYHTVSKYPAVERDLAIVVDESVLAETIEEIIYGNGKNIVAVNFFDEFTGGNIPKGKKSMAYTVRYQGMDQTLTDEEVNDSQNKIVAALEKEINAKLRA